MAKNRNKKKNGSTSTAMDITSDKKIKQLPQAMDTSESVVTNQPLTTSNRKIKGVQMKRTKNVRRMKAIAKAISRNEKSVMKVLKNESKTLRNQSAKKLYD